MSLYSEQGSAAANMTRPTTTLLTNGRIFSSAPGDERLHQAIVVQGGKVVFVGEEKQARTHVAEVCVVD
jgi:predicted amidohydrolase YtcJ